MLSDILKVLGTLILATLGLTVATALTIVAAEVLKHVL